MAKVIVFRRVGSHGSRSEYFLRPKNTVSEGKGFEPVGEIEISDEAVSFINKLIFQPGDIRNSESSLLDEIASACINTFSHHPK